MNFETTYVVYAQDTEGMAHVVDNLREHGADEIHAVWQEKIGVYKIEYKMEEGEEE